VRAVRGLLLCAQHNDTLHVLNIYSNAIGDGGAKALAEALKVRRE
jgi:hypothetical protein